MSEAERGRLGGIRARVRDSLRRKLNHEDPPNELDDLAELDEQLPAPRPLIWRGPRASGRQVDDVPPPPPPAEDGAEFWRCPQCTVSNEYLLLECSVCSAARPAAAAQQASFVCVICTYVNADVHASQCEMCGTKREAIAQPPDAPESKDDEGDGESRKFVLGETPVAFTRKMLVREHLAFQAGIEEAFGTIEINQHLLCGIERLVRRPFEALQKQFPPTPAQRGDIVITPAILSHLLKALVHRACQQALRAHRTLETILGCGSLEEQELALLHCHRCDASGQDRALHYSEGCGATVRHTYCLQCTHEYIVGLVASKQCQRVVCPFVDSATDRKCDSEVDARFIRRCLGQQEYREYLDECFNALISGPSSGGLQGGSGSEASFVHCPNAKCNSIMEIMQPHGLVVPDEIKETDESGKPLTVAAWLHFSSFRVRCHQCHGNFCGSCKSAPYHLGRSCEEQKLYLASKHCRFCSETLTDENTDSSSSSSAPVPPAFELVCNAIDCRTKRAMACPDMLACGHPCPGIQGEPYHPPCLIESCAAHPEAVVTSDSLCSICWVEELGAAPVVQLTSCNHIFHAACVSDKIAKRWPGVRISFGFMDCSLCKEPMNHPSPLVQAIRKPVDQLWKAISEKALARLYIEKMGKDQKLIDPQSRYYNQPLKYAMDCFAYYSCFKCSKFYFGGRRDCEANAVAENRPPEEFICFNCADLKSACKDPEHAEYQVFKCRFCCGIASWFCFGTTHYCDPCHKNDPMGKTRAARSTFKQCQGPAFCPCKVAHSPNGAEAECEFNLGCGLCNEQHDKLQLAKEKEKAVDAKAKEFEGGQSAHL